MLAQTSTWEASTKSCGSVEQGPGEQHWGIVPWTHL